MSGPKLQKDDCKMGIPIDSLAGSDLQIISSETASDNEPGLGWQLSEETERKFDEIDAYLRAGEQIVGRMLIG